MTQQEFEYAPRFDWGCDTVRSQRRIALCVAESVGLWFIAPLALWAAIIVGIVWYPLPSLLP